MDMSLTIQELERLFEPSRDAVLGLDGPSVVFVNPAARAVTALRPGDDAAEQLPEAVMAQAAGRFTVTGDRTDYTVTRIGDSGRLVTIVPHTPPAALVGVSERAVGVMGNELLNLRLTLDVLTRRTEVKSDPQTEVYASQLYQSYYRLKRLHSHLLLAGQLEREALPFEPRLLALNTLCSELCDTVSILLREKGLSLTYQGPDGSCVVRGDSSLLETLLLNLLANALQHSGPDARLQLSLRRLGTRAVIAVDDEAGGLTGDRLPGLFSGGTAPTLTEAADGAGLGLVVARGIAQLHNGSIIAETREGLGTLLRVWLPLADPRDADSLRSPPPVWRKSGMDAVLTELSVVLDRSVYNRKFFD